MPSLIVVSGPSTGGYYPLGKRTIVIGRDEGCPIQIVDELVSRKHMQVRLNPENDMYIAMDLKSANGMAINGRTINGEIELADGDTIELGSSKISFYLQDFDDRESAWAHHNERGQRNKNTLEQ